MELSCNCGYTVKGADPYKLQGEMWHHAIRDHQDMLKQMSVDQIAGLLKDHAQKLGLSKE